MKHEVYIIERELSWGPRVDDTLEFDSYEIARKYCVDYNVKHNTPDDSGITPDWYMYACLAVPREGDEDLIREQTLPQLEDFKMCGGVKDIRPSDPNLSL